MQPPQPLNGVRWHSMLQPGLKGDPTWRSASSHPGGNFSKFPEARPSAVHDRTSQLHTRMRSPPCGAALDGLEVGGRRRRGWVPGAVRGVALCHRSTHTNQVLPLQGSHPAIRMHMCRTLTDGGVITRRERAPAWTHTDPTSTSNPPKASLSSLPPLLGSCAASTRSASYSRTSSTRIPPMPAMRQPAAAAPWTMRWPRGPCPRPPP